MKKTILLLLLTTAILFSCKTSVKKGEVTIIENFPSEYVKPRNIEIYTPPGYSKEKSYPVLYMHDGQNVFNAGTSYTGVDWGVDEALDSLVNAEVIEPMIVVAAWNTILRSEEYCPNVISGKELSDHFKLHFPNVPDSLEIISDNYLKFLVKELKPFIDSAYSTLADQKNTFISGSSMGGLISTYAVTEYPEVFGAAACLSTHWPPIGDKLTAWISQDMPKAGIHRIYFDHGSVELDSLYKPFQLKVDSIMATKGYAPGDNYFSKEFTGTGHSEQAWNDRIHIPLEFLAAPRE